MNCSDDIIKLKGIGEKTAKLFHRLGIYTLKDLLFYYPRDYQAFHSPVKIAEGAGEDTAAVELSLADGLQWKKVRNLTIGTGIGTDGRDRISLTFFNTPYLKSKLTVGSSYLFRGKIKKENGRTSPKFLPGKNTGKK